MNKLIRYWQNFVGLVVKELDRPMFSVDISSAELLVLYDKMLKLKADSIIGAGDPVAVREAQNMTEHDRLKGELKSRAEIADEYYGTDYTGLGRDMFIQILARRDEMVLNYVAEHFANYIVTEETQKMIRALKGKLR